MTGEAAAPGRLAPQDAAKWKSRATMAAVCVSLVLIAIKLVAWLMSGSVAMMASLFDSSLDFLASLVNFFAVRHAITPADAEHRFGHGKAEAIAGLTQAAIILGSTTFLVIESLTRFAAPVAVAHAELSIAVMLISIALTGGLILVQRRAIRATGSIAISADHLHYSGDLAMNAMVIIAIGLSGFFGWVYADAIGGLAVAVIISYGAIQILRGSFDHLMDREFPDAEREQIKTIVRGHPDVRALHDLRTRSSGSFSFIQFHIELDPGITLMRAHTISDEVESRVHAAFPDADILIHQDPAGAEHPPKFKRKRT